MDDRLLIAFTSYPGQALQSLEMLMRQPLGSFNVIAVNWPTFRQQFLVQM